MEDLQGGDKKPNTKPKQPTTEKNQQNKEKTTHPQGIYCPRKMFVF